MKKSNYKIGIISMIVCVALVLSSIFYIRIEAQAASTTNKIPITCYTLNGRVTTYTNQACTSYSGYIDSTDLCRITNIYSNGAVRVQYPTPRGTKTAYARTSDFFKNQDFSTVTGKTNTRLTAYRRSTGNATIGSVYASDVCIVTGNENGRTQLIYPAGGSYKLGWVSGTYSFTGSDSSGSGAQIQNGTYVLRSALNNNKVVDAYGNASLRNGTNIQLCSYNGGPNQKYSITHVNSGWYKIICNWGDKSLDVHGGVGGNEINIELYDWHGGDNQLWRFVPAGNGYYYIQSKLGYYLDVWNNQTADETNIQIYQFNGGNNQKWKLDGVVAYTNNQNQNNSGNIIINGIDIGYAAGSYFTDNGRECTDHSISGIHSYYNEHACNCICTYKGKSLGAVQCFGFARYVQSKIYGFNSFDDSNAFYRTGYVEPGRLTASKLKSIIQNAKVGSHLRTNGNGHSMIITNITDSGFSIVQCNGSNNNEYSNHGACRIGTYTYTWSGYVNSTYGSRGINYIETIK